MTTPFEQICSYDNLELAFEQAKKGKTLKPYVIEFTENLHNNLLQLQDELIIQTYQPKPLNTFILRDPKTRKISKSDFRDRIVHHALCNVIEPIFDKCFIYDNYANRIGKGTLKAIERFDTFKRKVSQNNTHECFILKADVKHYFDTVDHDILLAILKRKIFDEKILWLIGVILSNHHTEYKKGMPLGNLTSQFLANVYLNELDQFVKHQLRATYYLRYVDDFVILHTSQKLLEWHMTKIDKFLQEHLRLQLHLGKSKITTLERGVNFLGFRIFYYHKLVRKKNIKRFERKIEDMKKEYSAGLLSREEIITRFEGWLAYVSHANTYKYRRHIVRHINNYFPGTFSTNKTKIEENHDKKVIASTLSFSCQKTFFLLKKGLAINQIAQERNIKEATVWAHLAQLIEHGQYSIWNVLSKEKIIAIIPKIRSENDTLTMIKQLMKINPATFDEINCALAYVKWCKKKESTTPSC